MSFAQITAHKPAPEAPFELVQVRVLAKTSLSSDTGSASLSDRADNFCETQKLEPHPTKAFVDADGTPTKRLYAAPQGSSRALAAVERSVSRNATLEQRVKLLETEMAQMKQDEDQKARDRRSATVVVSAAQALNAAFDCGGGLSSSAGQEAVRVSLAMASFNLSRQPNLFSDYRDRGTALGSTVCTLNAEVKHAFDKNPSWEGQIDVRNREAHPSPGSDLMLELLELEDKNVPLARESITFLLLAVRQRHLVDSKRDSVQEMMDEMKEISTAFPTDEQKAWLQRLDLGA